MQMAEDYWRILHNHAGVFPQEMCGFILIICSRLSFSLGFPKMVQMVKNLLANVEDAGLIFGLERSLREGNSNPHQYSCLENPMTEEPGGLQSMGSQRVRHD